MTKMNFLSSFLPLPASNSPTFSTCLLSFIIHTMSGFCTNWGSLDDDDDMIMVVLGDPNILWLLKDP